MAQFYIMLWFESEPPPKIHIEILTPNVMGLGGGAIGKWLGHDGGALLNEINALGEVKLMPL